MKYYAIARGLKTGIFTSWDEAKNYVIGFPNSKYKAFSSEALAVKFLNENGHSIQNRIQRDFIEKNFPNFLPTYDTFPQDNIEIDSSPNSLEDSLEDSSSNTSEDSTTNNVCSSFREKIYTDGSCIDEIGGYGYVYVKDGDKYQEYCGKIEGKSTNQVAELFAIYKALENCPFDNIDLYTDSKYSIGCLTNWFFRWQTNGWKNSKGETVANKKLIQDILLILRNKDVQFYHVYGHTGDKFNEICDQLANQGRML